MRLRLRFGPRIAMIVSRWSATYVKLKSRFGPSHSNALGMCRMLPNDVRIASRARLAWNPSPMRGRWSRGRRLAMSVERSCRAEAQNEKHKTKATCNARCVILLNLELPTHKRSWKTIIDKHKTCGAWFAKEELLRWSYAWIEQSIIVSARRTFMMRSVLCTGTRLERFGQAATHKVAIRSLPRTSTSWTDCLDTPNILGGTRSGTSHHGWSDLLELAIWCAHLWKRKNNGRR